MKRSLNYQLIIIVVKLLHVCVCGVNECCMDDGSFHIIIIIIMVMMSGSSSSSSWSSSIVTKKKKRGKLFISGCRGGVPTIYLKKKG